MELFNRSSSFILLQISFCLRVVLSSQIEEPQKNSGAPLSYNESALAPATLDLHAHIPIYAIRLTRRS